MFKTSVTKKQPSLDKQRVGSHSMRAYQVIEHHYCAAEEVAAESPLRRVTTPEEFADAALFFVSTWSRSVTGQNLVFDGGFVNFWLTVPAELNRN
ncbi:SDR family oxidoreductase [Cryobacterium sp. CG_9.6]|uniref:SDR family oxidoreductase n=1 Tax=Cryobacterium sp. CG_9.6 TaxID=2760710 RepID=UPI00247BE435|nr:enoyl-[acyl-carrier-protein] reductase (NADH) [Cryobacterium sp. CG_9.6]